MTLQLQPPPLQTAVDTNGAKISWPWLQWLQSLYTDVVALIGTNGGTNIEFPYAQFYDTTTQTAAAATSTAVTFNSTLHANGLFLSGTHIVVTDYAGYYNVQFSFQCANSSASIDDFTVWFRVNGSDVANTASLSGVPPKHGAIDGHLLVSANFVIRMEVNDYLELYWTTDNGSTSILTFPASAVPPVHPASPGVVVTLHYMSR